MPRLSVWMVRAALLHFGVGFSVGALVLFNKGVPLYSTIWRLLPLHIELVLVGWTIQLAMGVGFWILPRSSGQRGNVALGWLAFGLLNVGVLVVGVSQSLSWPALIALLGRIAELLAVAVYVSQMWPRIRRVGI